MTKIIGLTGGIGSGKSTIAKHIESLGVPVYIADDEAKKIMDEKATIEALTEAFGAEIIKGAKINRPKLSELVFQNSEKLKILNEIIHPRVKSHFQNWVKNHEQYPFVIKEAAILFESGSYKDCDKIILVKAPKNIRIQRVMHRDNTSFEDIEKRMANQWEDEKKEAMSHFVIENIIVEKAKKDAENIVSILRNS